MNISIIVKKTYPRFESVDMVSEDVNREASENGGMEKVPFKTRVCLIINTEGVKKSFLVCRLLAVIVRIISRTTLARFNISRPANKRRAYNISRAAHQVTKHANRPNKATESALIMVKRPKQTHP